MKLQLILPLLILMSILVVPIHAADLTDCWQPLDIGENNLSNDIVFDSTLYYAYCFAIGSGSILNCQGHTIDMNNSEANAIYVPFGNPNTIIKNCILQNVSIADAIFWEWAGSNTIDNVTFINANGVFAEFENDAVIINSKFYNTSGHGIAVSGLAGNYYNITNNTFSGVTVAISLIGGYEHNIYNNKFMDGNSSISDTGLNFINYNTTNSSDINILGFPAYGGNYWGSCQDTDNNGYCDNPTYITENNIDYYPLSTNFLYPTIPIDYTYFPLLNFQSEYTFNQTGSITTQFITHNRSGKYFPVNNGTCYAQVFYPNNSIFIPDTLMTNIPNSSGFYKIDFTTPFTEGIYIIDTKCIYNLTGIYSGGTFHVSNLTQSYDYLQTIIKPLVTEINTTTQNTYDIVLLINSTVITINTYLLDFITSTLNNIYILLGQVNQTTTANNEILVSINNSLVPNTVWIW